MNKGGLGLLCFLWQGLADNVPTRTGRGRKPNNMGTMQEQNKQRGFTLVELITVMVIVGILAVAVLPRFFEVSTFEDRGSADQVKSLLRFAQKTAIAQHQNISVAISGGAASSDCTKKWGQSRIKFSQFGSPHSPDHPGVNRSDVA